MITATERIRDVRFEPGSFRDRGSRVIYVDGKVYRVLDETAAAEWDYVVDREFLPRLMSERRIVGTTRASFEDDDLPVGDGWHSLLAHETLPFVSYPYEWSFSMLRDAALLHLELIQEGLGEDVILKDATSFNVQFNGAAPIFIDVGSFKRLQPGEPWIGYRQFCQTMLYPLMLQAYWNVDFQPWLRGRLEGILPRQLLNLASLADLFRRGVFAHVWLHSRMEQGFGDAAERMPETLSSHGFHKDMILHNVRGLIRLIERLNWKPAGSAWSDYMDESPHVRADFEAKQSFVRSVAAAREWDLVWDLGCNTGRYARTVSEYARCVVAMDSDHLTIDRLYQSLRAEGCRRVLPLVVNLADASPALGWRGRERLDLPSRGRPQLTLSLALLHHLVIRENILLADLIDWVAGLGTEWVVEFVDKGDFQVRSLLRNKADQYADYSLESFERLLAGRFEVRRRQQLPSGTRTLFHAVPRTRDVA